MATARAVPGQPVDDWAGYSSYTNYLRSPGFQKRRAAFIMLAGNRCQHCHGQGKRYLVIHHLRYDTIGHEDPEDVEVLCPRCHWRAEPENRHQALDIWWLLRAERDA